MDNNKIFEDAHEKGCDLLGVKWILLNERAAHIATLMGIDIHDKNMRAFISQIVLEMAEGMLEMDNLQRDDLQEKYLMTQKDKK